MQLNECLQEQITEVVLKASAPWVLEIKNNWKRYIMYNAINSSLAEFQKAYPEIAVINAEIMAPHHVHVSGRYKWPLKGGKVEIFSFRINLFDDSSEVMMEDEMTEDERVEAILNELARHVPPDMYRCCDTGIISCEDGSLIVTARFAPRSSH